jgi:hypothetical protein
MMLDLSDELDEMYIARKMGWSIFDKWTWDQLRSIHEAGLSNRDVIHFIETGQIPVRVTFVDSNPAPSRSSLNGQS